MTYKDVPQTRFTLAGGQSYPEPSPPYDRRILDQQLRYVGGDEVAIVAAADEKTALEALKAIDVEYEVQTAVLDLPTAVDHAHVVHGEQPYTNFDVGNDSSRNIAASHCLEEGGDVDGAFGACDVVVEQTYNTQHKLMP